LTAGLHWQLACIDRWPALTAGLHWPLACFDRWPALAAGLHWPLAYTDRSPTRTAGLHWPLACQNWQVPAVKLQPSARPAAIIIRAAARFMRILF